MRKLHNASLATKSLLQALVCCVIVLAIAALAISTFAAYQRADREQDRAIEVADRLRDAWIDLGRGQAELYRDQSEVSERRARYREIREGEGGQSIDSARSALNRLDLSGMPINPELAAKATKSIAGYSDAAAQAASFVEADAYAATMFMTDAEQKFELARQDVSALVETAVRLENELGERMGLIVQQRKVAMRGGALIAVVLCRTDRRDPCRNGRGRSRRSRCHYIDRGSQRGCHRDRCRGRGTGRSNARDRSQRADGDQRGAGRDTGDGAQRPIRPAA